MIYPVLRNCCLRARARALAWLRRATWFRRWRQSDSRMAWARGSPTTATASTACSNRRASGSVIPSSPFFPPQPPLLQHQEPQGQECQRLVVVPAPPALHLVVPQPHLLLAAQEPVLHRPARVRRPRLLPQR